MKRDEEIASEVKGLIKKVKVDTNGEMSTVTMADDVYVDSLDAAGLDIETVKKVGRFNSKFIDTMAAVTTEVAKTTMTKNKKVNQVNGSYSFADNGTCSVRVDRERIARSPKDGTEVKSPRVTSVVKWQGLKGSKAFHTRLKTSLAESLGK